jgi:hypothetical protein
MRAEKKSGDRPHKEQPFGSRMLTPDERDELRRSARKSIEYFKAHFRENPL